MSDEMELRVVFGHLEGDTYPCCIGAMDMTRWEIIGDDEWQKTVRGWKEDWDRDWQSYSYREINIKVSVPLSLVAAPALDATAEPDKEG